MKYLITGITGFAGPHLANLLIQEGHEVYGLIRHTNGRQTDILDVVPPENFEKITFVYGDLVNFRVINGIFRQFRFDGVYHLAAQSHPPTSFIDPLGTFEANIMGSANVIQAIADNQPDCKLMFCSTSEVYGNIGMDGRKIKSNDTILPANPYGASKAATDLYLQERFTNKKVRGFITRAFSHTGPRRGRTFSISSDAYQLARMMNGEPGRKLLVGNLKSVRVVLDVRDIVKAYYLLMINNKSDGRIFNVCGDVPREMGFYTDTLIALSRLGKVEKEVSPALFRPIDIHYQHGDCEDLVQLTGWKPAYDISTTLGDLLEYWVKKMSPGKSASGLVQRK
jgi:GDP-4-dehydro-6-deoxy-D-mannose reductase